MTEPKAITRIQVQGFRSLKSIDLEPGRITVLIGANGSGKSNLLSVLRMVPPMCLAMADVDQVADGPFACTVTFGDRVPYVTRLDVDGSVLPEMGQDFLGGSLCQTQRKCRELGEFSGLHGVTLPGVQPHREHARRLRLSMGRICAMQQSF